MTREEAIKELERAFDVLDHSCHMDNRRKEAFNMARVALSAEPCEDTISRLECIEYFENTQDLMLFSKGFVLKYLKEKPSVTPKQKMGHWVNGEHCSECGCDIPAYIIDWEWQKDMDAKYCPQCGAKMEEARG